MAIRLGALRRPGLVAGLLAGLVVLGIRKWKVPAAVRGIMPVVVIPLLSTLIVGILMFVVLGPPLAALTTGLTNWLTGRSGATKIILGIILGLMMAFDMGGPINKTAYSFAALGLTSAPPDAPTNSAPFLIMAAVMLAGYGLWQIFRWGGHQHQALIGDLLLLVPNGALVSCAWMVSRHQDLGRRTCRAWRLLTVALCLYMLGDVLQLVYEVLLHRRAYPTWADAAYLSFYLVAGGGGAA